MPKVDHEGQAKSQPLQGVSAILDREPRRQHQSVGEAGELLFSTAQSLC